jgi:alcohol dehydrogenase
LVPAETLTVLDSLGGIGAARLTALTRLTIPYGGLLKSGLRPGQTAIIGGATGNLGAAAVLVALAMGAAKVVAVGRDEEAMAALETINPQRVVAVALKGDGVEKDAERIRSAAPPIDVYFDMTGRALNPEPILAAVGALRRGGTAVFMGGVKADLPLSYKNIMINELTIRGNFMYPRSAPKELASMVRAGLLDLSVFNIVEFPLANIEEAIDRAGASKGFNLVVVKPNE